VLSTPSVAS